MQQSAPPGKGLPSAEATQQTSAQSAAGGGRGALAARNSDGEHLRASLAATLLRGRPRPPTPRLVEGVRPVPAPLGTAHAVGDIAWSRALLSAPDGSEPHQATIPLLFAQLAGPQTGSRPAVVMLHGTGCCGESCAGRAVALAQRGILVVLPDSRHHGYRADGYQGHGVPWDNGQYQDALVRAWERNGETRPFAYDTAADMFYVADYLASRADVTALAITGISLGGIHAWFAAAADTRWEVVAPLIGVQNFEYAAKNNCATARVSTIPRVFDRAALGLAAKDGLKRRSCCEEVVRGVWARICPGLLDGKYDALHTLPLIAPRALFIGNGRDDPRCPVDGLVAIVDKVRSEYQRTVGESSLNGRNAQLPFVAKFYECAHEVSDDMWSDCVDFIDRSLSAIRP